MKLPYEKPQVKIVEIEINENVAVNTISGEGPDLILCYITEY